VTAVGREGPLISGFLTTALEKLLANNVGKSRILKIDSPPPGNFPIADLQFKNMRVDFQPTADLHIVERSVTYTRSDPLKPV
jgi:hypothetical protein